MPKIDADAPLDGSNALRASLVYGPSRAGKTVFDATFPRPAIFCSAREGGYISVQTMDRDLWYEANRKPIIYAVNGIAETAPYFKEVEAGVRKGQIKTIVIELTFYSQDVIRAAKKTTDDQWAVYRLLDEHIQWLDKAAKALGVRVAYNSLAADGDTATKVPGGLLLPGKAVAKSLPASTDLTGYLHAEERANNKIDRVLHLAPHGVFPAGHRYGDKLPNIVRNPTFRKLEDLITGRAFADAEGNVLYGEAAKAARATAAQQAAAAPPAAPAPTPASTTPSETDSSAELPPL